MKVQATPVVSVIMGVYNGAGYVTDAVQSVLDQTFDDFEFIIVNDASTDATAGILREFSDRRMRIITNEKNEGLTRCLIRGCNEARGKYIARMDADDVSYPERFEKQVEFLDGNPDYAAVGTQCHFLDTKGNTRGVSDYPLAYEDIGFDIWRRCPFAHGSTMFVREAFIACGGYRESFRYAQDYDLWFRVIEKYKAANLPDVLYGLRYHRGSLTLQKLPFQHAFVELAREFARERGERGTDPILRGETEQLKRRIDSWRKTGFLEKRKIRSESALQLLDLMIDLGTVSDVVHLWFAAAANNPFNKRVWKFFHSTAFRVRMKRGLRNRLYPGVSS